MECTVYELVDLVLETKRATERELKEKLEKERDDKPKHYLVGFEVSYCYYDAIDGSKGMGFHLIYAEDEGKARMEVIDYIKKVAIAHNLKVVENLVSMRYEFRIGEQLHYFIDKIKINMVARKAI